MRFRWPRFPRFRFRTATLLWLVVVVAAFFVGRQSDDIGARLSQLWHAIWPTNAPYRLVNQPNGSLLFISKSRVTGVTGLKPELCTATLPSANQALISPVGDGALRIGVWNYAEGKQSYVTLDLVIKDGSVTVENETTSPATTNSSSKRKSERE